MLEQKKHAWALAGTGKSSLVTWALAGTGKSENLGARWDRKVVWDEIIVMTPGRSLGRTSCLGRDPGVLRCPGAALGPERRFW